MVSHYSLVGASLGKMLDGASAVILFFVLSGYCLTLPFLHNGLKGRITAFYIRRFFRIYPAFLVSMLLVLVCCSFFQSTGVGGTFLAKWEGWGGFFDLPTLVKHALLIYPGDEFNRFNPVVWSLVVEMKMSLIFPVLLYLTLKLRFRILMPCLVILLAGAFLRSSPLYGYLFSFWVGSIIAKHPISIKWPWATIVLGLDRLYFILNLLVQLFRAGGSIAYVIVPPA